MRPVPAAPQDVDALYRLRRQLEDWLPRMGVDQWLPGEVARSEIAAQVEAGQWFLAALENLPVAGALCVLWADPQIWGSGVTPAVYVHSLMVDRRMAGRGLGSSLLHWAADEGRRRGLGVLRLDCAESNLVLRDYYRTHGLREVGRKDFDRDWFSATLFELDL